MKNLFLLAFILLPLSGCSASIGTPATTTSTTYSTPSVSSTTYTEPASSKTIVTKTTSY